MKTETARVAMNTARASQKATAAFWGTLFFSAGYLAAILACLWQGSSPNPWSRVDIFSGGFFALTLLWMAGTILLHGSFFRSAEVVQEVSGKNFDPNMLIWITLLSAADLLIFLDYGHWRLTPALQNPVLQGIGLGLLFVAGLFLFWADTYLAHHFANGLNNRKVIDAGPFRIMRHPRYASLLAGRVAYALIFASAIGWVLAAIWLAVILQWVRVEEIHLRRIFGADYDAYAARTARLFPGIDYSLRRASQPTSASEEAVK